MGFKALDVAVSLMHTPCAVLAALTALTSSPCSRWRSAPWIDGDGGLWRVPLNLRSASGGFLSLWWIYLAVRENHCPLLHQQMGWTSHFLCFCIPSDEVLTSLSSERPAQDLLRVIVATCRFCTVVLFVVVFKNLPWHALHSHQAQHPKKSDSTY